MRRPRAKNRTAAIPLAVQAMEGTFAPREIGARELHEQMSYRAAGNPPGTLPTTAISNCFPGLELDFRNVWKHIFKGIEMHESDNLVVGTEDDPAFRPLLFRRLMRIRLRDRSVHPMVTVVHGPDDNGRVTDLRINALEWSNALACVLREAGNKVKCEFTTGRSQRAAEPGVATETFELEVRNVFEPGTAVIARDILGPGELTQSLCSPWQNDYRECACYYWAASRPDYVNVEPGSDGTSFGQNWMQDRKGRPRPYQIDDFDGATVPAGLISYEDLFRKWQTILHFEIRGRDTD